MKNKNICRYGDTLSHCRSRSQVLYGYLPGYTKMIDDNTAPNYA